MVTSDFRLEVEIRPFCAYAVIMQYNPYLWPNRRKLCLVVLRSFMLIKSKAAQYFRRSTCLTEFTDQVVVGP